MSYREPTDALRAELREAKEQAERELSRAEELRNKLDRAESALAAYKSASSDVHPSRAARGAWVAVLASVGVWLASIVAVMQDADPLGSHLAAAAAAVAFLSPLVVQAAAGSLAVGVVSAALRFALVAFVTMVATARTAARSDGDWALFWLAPAALVIGAVVECSWLIRRSTR